MSTTNSREVVLVTGASTGLGLAIARELRGRDFRLILTARSSSLHRFAEHGIHESETVRIRPLDVTDATQREQIIHEANVEWGGVDVLINNAGIAYRAVVEHFTEQDDRDEMSVNFNAPMELIRLVLPRMREKRKGRIISISSVGGMMAMPTMALYSASKFALEGACEALWYEVRPWNIKVSLVEPGFIRSEGFTHTRYTEMSRHAQNDPNESYHRHYIQMAGFIEKLMRRCLATPESVARKIARLISRENPPLRVPVTLDAFLFGWLRAVAPRRFYHWMLYRCLPGVSSWGNQNNPQSREIAKSDPPTAAVPQTDGGVLPPAQR